MSICMSNPCWRCVHTNLNLVSDFICTPYILCLELAISLPMIKKLMNFDSIQRNLFNNFKRNSNIFEQFFNHNKTFRCIIHLGGRNHVTIISK